MDKPAGRRLSAARRALLACALLLSAGTLAAGAPANATGSVLDRLEQLGNPLFAPDRREVDDAIRDGVRLPGALIKPIHDELTRRLAAQPSRVVAEATDEPTAVLPGSLGTWTEEAG